MLVLPLRRGTPSMMSHAVMTCHFMITCHCMMTWRASSTRSHLQVAYCGGCSHLCEGVSQRPRHLIVVTYN